MIITELHWSTQSSFQLLACLQFFPLLVMGMIYVMRESPRLFALSVIASLVELALVVQLYRIYLPHESAMQLAESFTLLAPFQYHVAVDGVSVMFMMLTAMLSLMLVLYSYVIPIKQRNDYW